MPSWATEFSMNVFIKFVIEDLLPSSMSDEESLKTLWLADFLKVKDLVEICIVEYIKPQIKEENVLVFIDDAYAKLKQSVNEEEVWYDLLDYCLEFISDKNPIEILRQKPHKLSRRVIDEIVERKLFKSQGIPDLQLLTLLKERRKQEDLIQLFINE